MLPCDQLLQFPLPEGVVTEKIELLQPLTDGPLPPDPDDPDPPGPPLGGPWPDGPEESSVSESVAVSVLSSELELFRETRTPAVMAPPMIAAPKIRPIIHFVDVARTIVILITIF